MPIFGTNIYVGGRRMDMDNECFVFKKWFNLIWHIRKRKGLIEIMLEEIFPIRTNIGWITFRLVVKEIVQKYHNDVDKHLT